MSEELREILFFQLDWDDAETREHKLAILKDHHGLEYVRHEHIPERHEYRVFFKDVER